MSSKISIKDVVYGSSIILLIGLLGITINDTSSWYYCELENSMRECDSLSSYGVVDAKCVYFDGGVKKSDICTRRS